MLERIICWATGGHRLIGTYYRLDLGKRWTRCVRCDWWRGWDGWRRWEDISIEGER